MLKKSTTLTTRTVPDILGLGFVLYCVTQAEAQGRDTDSISWGHDAEWSTVTAASQRINSVVMLGFEKGVCGSVQMKV